MKNSLLLLIVLICFSGCYGSIRIPVGSTDSLKTNGGGGRFGFAIPLDDEGEVRVCAGGICEAFSELDSGISDSLRTNGIYTGAMISEKGLHGEISFATVHNEYVHKDSSDALNNFRDEYNAFSVGIQIGYQIKYNSDSPLSILPMITFGIQRTFPYDKDYSDTTDLTLNIGFVHGF